MLLSPQQQGTIMLRLRRKVYTGANLWLYYCDIEYLNMVTVPILIPFHCFWLVTWWLVPEDKSGGTSCIHPRLYHRYTLSQMQAGSYGYNNPELVFNREAVQLNLSQFRPYHPTVSHPTPIGNNAVRQIQMQSTSQMAFNLSPPYCLNLPWKLRPFLSLSSLIRDYLSQLVSCSNEFYPTGIPMRTRNFIP